jgi:hypothetical protein
MRVTRRTELVELPCALTTVQTMLVPFTHSDGEQMRALVQAALLYRVVPI